jgi:hypothetical protein
VYVAGIRARCAADGGLIDLDHLIDQVETGDRAVLAGFRTRAIYSLRCGSIQNVVNESRFTTAGNAGHQDEEAQRKVDVDVLQIVFGRAANGDARAGGRAMRASVGNGSPAGKILPGERRRGVLDVDRLALRDQLTAEAAGAGTEVDHVIGTLDSLGIVLDDEHGVAQVAQSSERIEQTIVVARVQSDGRLVEHVEHSRAIASRSAWPGGCAALRRPKASPQSVRG